MGLSQALFSAISGLANHQTRMDNIGNNISNVNTVGFKQGIHQFHTLLSQTIRGGMAANGATGGINPLQIGLGTATSSIRQDFTQGSLETTGNQRDLAIEGNGFFVLDTGIEGEVWGQAYTRDGSFYLSSEGALLSSDGLHVLGYDYDKVTNTINTTTLSHIDIDIGATGGAQETTEMSMTGNLNSDVNVAAPYTIPAGDTSWVALGGLANAINVGSVQTSAVLFDFNSTGGAQPPAAGGATATMATDLANLGYLKGTSFERPFNGITAGDTIDISFRKGGRLETATFTYGAYPAGDGTTLQDYMTFLTGGINDTATAGNRMTGGAMGTVRLEAKTQATHGYNATEEHAGAYLRTYAAGATGTVDFDGVLPLATDNTNRVSIASNLGEENAITNIEFTYNNVSYTDMFAQDANYGSVTGGSTTANMTVYDSLGNPHNVTMQMTLVGRDTNFSTWRWIADCTDDTDATWEYGAFNDSANATTSTNIGSGLIRFDNQGRYVAGSDYSETNGLEIDLTGQGTAHPIQIDITNGLSSAQTQDLDFSSLTQVAAAYDFSLNDQDGSAPGTLDSFSVTADGIVNGIFSNGVIAQLGQLAIAMVDNPNGLLQIGHNNYIEGPASGEPRIGLPQAGGRGSIRAGQLELSNVDLSKEFTNLIVTERGFQANARVISTSDEMLTELVNLKR